MTVIRQTLGVVLSVLMLLSCPPVLAAQATDAPPAPDTTNEQPTAPGGNAAPNQKAAPTVGWLELSGPLRDRPLPVAFASGQEKTPSLRGVVEQLEYVAGHDHYKGLVIYLDQVEVGLAQVYELAEAIAKVKKAGKKVLVFSEAYDLPSYLLACSADEILLQRKGQVELASLSMEEMYMLGLLEKVGAKADFLQVGKFKGASESLTRTGPSEEWNQNIDSLLDDAYDQVLTRIAKARRLTRDQVEKLFADTWDMSDEQYVRRRVVDRLVDRDLIEATAAAFGEEFTWDEAMGQTLAAQQVENPFAMLRMLFQGQQNVIRRPSIALVHAGGAIHSGESSSSEASAVAPRAGLFGGDSIGSRTIVEVLGDVRDNDLIKGVVIRIDSPGGSALASEVMWQAIREVAQDKPVYISIGDMAASGGYYMACAGHKVYASPNSIVGSIGVVGGKIVLAGLYEKVGVTVHRRSRGPMGDIYNSVEPFTPQQRKAIAASMQRTYEQFLDRVKTGRGKKIDNLDAVAQGRIFTGRQALVNGLIDALGGVEAAIMDIAAECGLAEGTYDVVDLPEPMSLAEYLEQMFSFGVTAPPIDTSLLATARHLLGPAAWEEARRTLDGVMLLRDESVLTLMPRVIRVK